MGRQELEIILGEAHISFTTTKLGSLMQVQQSKDPDGLRIFYYLVQVCERSRTPCAQKASYGVADISLRSLTQSINQALWPAFQAVSNMRCQPLDCDCAQSSIRTSMILMEAPFSCPCVP